jgi:D-glycerate 3-kinase
MIKVPNMSDVYESRWLQEQTLLKTISSNSSDNKIMDKTEVYRFVMHYERLTRYIIDEIPSFADIVLCRDKNFKFSFVKKP